MITARNDAELTTGRMLWTQFGLHASCAAGALIGGLVGASLLSDIDGLDFVLSALFVVFAIDAYRARPDRVALALAASTAVTALVIAPGSMIWSP